MDLDVRRDLKAKYALDRFAASVLLLLISPLFAAISIASAVSRSGPIFFRQERIGLGGEPFEIWKFRTMVPDAFAAGGGYVSDDLVTPIGRLLRRTSLDELPQLLNIVRGEMSFVGPRPTIRSQVERYSPEQMRRLSVKPGVAGWAQLHGRHSLAWSRRIEYDLEYVDRAGVLFDLRILIVTPFVLLFKDDYIDYAGASNVDDLGTG